MVLIVAIAPFPVEAVLMVAAALVVVTVGYIVVRRWW
jgi:hypothetical protein